MWLNRDAIQNMLLSVPEVFQPDVPQLLELIYLGKMFNFGHFQWSTKWLNCKWFEAIIEFPIGYCGWFSDECLSRIIHVPGLQQHGQVSFATNQDHTLELMHEHPVSNRIFCEEHGNARKIGVFIPAGYTDNATIMTFRDMVAPLTPKSLTWCLHVICFLIWPLHLDSFCTASLTQTRYFALGGLQATATTWTKKPADHAPHA